jgi:hypothetical protein
VRAWTGTGRKLGIVRGIEGHRGVVRGLPIASGMVETRILEPESEGYPGKALGSSATAALALLLRVVTVLLTTNAIPLEDVLFRLDLDMTPVLLLRDALDLSRLLHPLATTPNEDLSLRCLVTLLSIILVRTNV